MNNKFYTIIVTAALCFGVQTLEAQQKEKKEKVHPKQEKIDKKISTHKHSHDGPEHSHDKHEADHRHDHDDDGLHQHHDEKSNDKNKVNQGKGHAYGKHKDGLEGREFGQFRAEQAREQLNGFEQSYKAKQGLVIKAEKSIENAKNRLAELENSKELNEEALAIYRFKITRAEKRLNDLKFLLVEKKDFTKRQRGLLEEIYED